MTEPIETTFKVFNYDLVKQLVARAEEKFGKPVKAVWINRALLPGIVKTWVHDEIALFGERGLILLGYLANINLRHMEDSTIRLMLSKDANKDPWDGVEYGRVCGVDLSENEEHKGNKMFVATQEMTNDKAN